jgi:RimJ/RimL family protein N-acetyltransferase
MLTTDRLVLTPPVPADLDDMVALWTDPAVYERLVGRAFSREEVWHRLLRYIGHWQVAGYGHWTVRTHADGRFVGEVGIMDSRRDTAPRSEGVPEVGWALMGRAQGHGYAREALGALFGWADARLPRTVCIIDPANAASLRLATRVGYTVYAEGTYKDRATLFLERSAPRG